MSANTSLAGRSRVPSIRARRPFAYTADSVPSGGLAPAVPKPQASPSARPVATILHAASMGSSFLARVPGRRFDTLDR